ncbi:MAG TPA: hypothetical protein VIM11_16900 [Tepidisphaeraceae bacterium]
MRSIAAADDLIRRERLNEVRRYELRSMAVDYVPVADWSSLRRQPCGTDDAEVAALKQLARLQEPFRSHGVEFTWWGRFVSSNSPATCLAILRMMVRARGQHPHLVKSNRLLIDWLDLLRRALSVTPTRNPADVEAAFREIVNEAGND